MATIPAEPETEADIEPVSQTPPSSGEMDEALLVNRMPEWFRAPRSLAGFVLLIGILHVLLSHRPIWHTDVWAHLAYGRLISETRSIPETEPFMPLSKGIPVVDTAWLSRVVGFQSHRLLGITSLQFLYAAMTTSCLGLFCWQCYRRNRSFGLTVIGCALFLWVEWQTLKILRPQLVGVLCFMILWNVLTSRDWHRRSWIVIPVLFATWANLHGSFPVGLGLLAAMIVGRAFDVLLRATSLPYGKRLIAAVRDTRVRRYFLLLELAAVAVLLNPYGLGLYVEVFQFSSHPNLARFVEWSPLTLRLDDGRISQQGAAVAVISALLIVLYRLSPRRVFAVEPLLLFGLGVSMLWTSRMIVWWSPIAAYFAVLHGSAVSHKWRRLAYDREALPSTSLWAVVSLGTIWIAFAYTPFGTRLLDGEEPSREKSLSKQTPYLAADELRKQPPLGQIFNTLAIGDYLIWAGPKDLKVFVSSHAHLIPKEVMDDYFHIVFLDPNWESLLERYRVNTIVLDPTINDRLADALEDTPDWKRAYSDDRSVIFVRRSPISDSTRIRAN